MNLIFETNYAAFSIFAALLLTEVISAVVLLLFYDAAKTKVLAYVVPIWEVTGTFAAFWVVTGDMAYPTLLIPVATIFGALLTIFLITLVARNATIVFGEFIVKRKWLDAKKLYQAYALSTLLVGVSVLILLSSLVSGAGILNHGKAALTTPFDFLNWASKGGSWLFVIGTLLIGVGVAPVFFDIRPLAKKFVPLAVIGVLLSIVGYYAYSPSLVTGSIAIPTLLTIVVALLYLWKKTAPIVTNKAIFITVLSIIIFSLQPLVYPKFVGQVLSIDALTTTGPMASVFYETTWAGGALLAVMVAVYLSVVMKQKRTISWISTTAPNAKSPSSPKVNAIEDDRPIDKTGSERVQ